MKISGAGVTLAMGALYAWGCGGGGGGGDDGGSVSGDAPAPISAPPARQEFSNVTSSSGIAFENGLRGLVTPDYVSRFANSGAAAGDYDDDGDIDLFITRGDIGQNLLYRNNGFGVFEEVAQSAGVAFTATATENYRHSSPIFADMDGDRDLDLFIGSLWNDPNFLFANNGDGTFSDVTAGSGIDTMLSEHSIAATFGDYDLDGDLDLAVAGWHFRRGGNRLFRNNGDGTFSDVTGVLNADLLETY
jgi:hypothetical protein